MAFFIVRGSVSGLLRGERPSGKGGTHAPRRGQRGAGWSGAGACPGVRGGRLETKFEAGRVGCVGVSVDGSGRGVPDAGGDGGPRYGGRRGSGVGCVLAVWWDKRFTAPKC